MPTDDLFLPATGLAGAELALAEQVAGRLGYSNGRAYLVAMMRRALARDARKVGLESEPATAASPR